MGQQSTTAGTPRAGWISRTAPALLLAALLAGAGFAADTGDLFEALGPESGLDFVHFNGMVGELYFAEMMGSGLALFDYDGDGDLDLYLVQGTLLDEDDRLEEAVFQPAHPLPPTDRLYRNDGMVERDGRTTLRFVDVTAAAGLTASLYGMGVAAGDFDNDGWTDLYVANFGANQLLRNNGDGTFSDVTAASGADDRRWSVSPLFLDYEADGWLDLYVGNYVDYRMATHRACASATGAMSYCGPTAYEPVPDKLLRNKGDGTFEDVSESSGIGLVAGASLGAVAGNFNGDRWLDLYVAVDQAPNYLWINRGDGTFTDEALLAGCAVSGTGQPQAGMGVLAADFDGDGSEDIFLSHLTRETNTLYLNDGSGYFRDASLASGLGVPSLKFTGFGTALFDYDQDGWLDLFVANGAVHRIEAQLAAGDPHPLHQTNQLFRNLGGGRFEETTEAAGAALAPSYVSRGLATGDVDNDGDADVALSNNAGPAELLLNRLGQEARWLGLRVVGVRAPRDLFGARIALTPAGGRTLWRRGGTGGSYASAGDPRVLFGLGPAAQESGGPVEARVEWPGGGVSRYRDLPVGRYLTLRAAER